MFRAWSSENTEDKDEFKTDVLILGAGMAGIAAAETLNNLGAKKFLVVEGSDRYVSFLCVLGKSPVLNGLKQERKAY